MPAGYPLILVNAQADGTQISNSTTQASIIPAAAKYTMPANFLQTIGQKIRMKAMGRVSNVVTTPGTLLFEVRVGATAATVLATSQAMALNTTAKTNSTWWLEWEFTLRAIGASTSANFMHAGMWTSESAVGAAAGTAVSINIPASAPAVSNGFDTTIANQWDLQAKFSVATSPTNLTLHTYELWADN